ncbi:MAG: NAD(P)/FAD-dependent oxidoreductase [Chloroflexota bacterium]|nr:NAD(P)/FAD-dependent oxidoreductase [Chloroflexota bacterium]
MTEQPYDVIVIGSGIGGLTFASLMAQLAHKRVLVLERHFKLGGFTHTFERKGYTWDVGLHYVGELDKGSTVRALFDFITRSQVKWHKMPHFFERFVYPDFTFNVSDVSSQYLQDLIQQFPTEKAALQRYFRDLKRGAKWYTLETWRRSVPSWLGWPVSLLNLRSRRMALSTTKEYLDRSFKDLKLKALLASQWGDYGLTPSQSAFALHALVVGNYLKGGWYPEGSAETIAESIVPIIKEAGGDCRVNHEVAEILVENGVAKGVRVHVKHGKKIEEKLFLAPLIVSDAGIYNTFTKLVPESVPLPQREEIKRFKPGATMVTLYLGLKENPQKLGFKGENHWLFSGYDHDMPQNQKMLEGEVNSAYLSFPSLKDPAAKQPTAEIIAKIDYGVFAAWQNTNWKQRGQNYEDLKARISEVLLETVERHYPGFRELVAYQELSTPVTIESFTNHFQGAIYSLPGTPEKLQRFWNGPSTPIKGLLLTGTDVCALGIVGAMMGGTFAAGYVLGPLGFPKVMSAAQTYAHLASRNPSKATILSNQVGD